VADFAKEVAALQEENKHLKQLLHNQVWVVAADSQHMTHVHAAAGNCADSQHSGAVGPGGTDCSIHLSMRVG
jgi:hypothetical protein